MWLVKGHLLLHMRKIAESVTELASRRRWAETRFPRNKRYYCVFWLALFASALSAEACSQSASVLTPEGHQEPQEPRMLAITHITVINPGTGAEEQRDMTVLLRGLRIVAVEKSAEAHIPTGAEVHDEQGRYVMPGLWDAHVHLLQVGPKAFPLFLANGITSVRDMGSD